MAVHPAADSEPMAVIEQAKMAEFWSLVLSCLFASCCDAQNAVERVLQQEGQSQTYASSPTRQSSGPQKAVQLVRSVSMGVRLLSPLTFNFEAANQVI